MDENPTPAVGIEAYDEVCKTVIEKLKTTQWEFLPTSTIMFQCGLCGCAVSTYARTAHIEWHESQFNVIRSLLVPYDKIYKSLGLDEEGD